MFPMVLRTLSLRLKAGQDAFGIHSGFDQLEGHLALDRLGLLGNPHRTHPPFPDRFQQFVATGDDDAGCSETGLMMVGSASQILPDRIVRNLRAKNGETSACSSISRLAAKTAAPLGGGAMVGLCRGSSSIYLVPFRQPMSATSLRSNDLSWVNGRWTFRG